MGRNYEKFSGDSISKPKVVKDYVNNSLERIAKSHEFVYEQPSFSELSPNKVNLFSSEMLSEVFNFERSALRIKRMFPDAKVIVSIREQKSLIKSIYLNEVYKGQVKKLSHILNGSNVNGQRIIGRPEIWLPHLLYYEMLCFYRSLFGDNVLVLPIEMASDESFFFERLESFLLGRKYGNAVKKAKWSDTKLKNKDNTGKVDPGAVGLWRLYNRMIRERNKSRSETVILNIVGRHFMGAGRRALDSQVKDIGSFYAKSNRDLAEELGIDLERYGYDVY